MKKPDIYTTSICPYCLRAKDLLQRKGVEYNEINAEDPKVRADMVTKAGGKMTVPQIFIGDKHVGGYDDLQALEDGGKLDAMLK